MDTAVLSGMNLNAAEQQAVGQIMQRRMVQDIMKFVNGMTEKCFESCVTDFSSKSLSSREETCIKNCADKIKNYTERVTASFQAEATAAMEKHQSS